MISENQFYSFCKINLKNLKNVDFDFGRKNVTISFFLFFSLSLSLSFFLVRLI